jgi:crossover junction endodeoxyribonuclease RuvC
MVILGIDPGSRITGYGIVESIGNGHRYIASGCIKTKGDNLSERLLQIYEGLSIIISRYLPTQAAIEQIFVKNNVDSALKLGQARGAAFVAVANYKIPLAEYAPRVVKKAVVGFGGADKQQVQQMIKILLCLSDLPPTDAADALAIALCHASHSTLKERIA